MMGRSTPAFLRPVVVNRDVPPVGPADVRFHIGDVVVGDGGIRQRTGAATDVDGYLSFIEGRSATYEGRVGEGDVGLHSHDTGAVVDIPPLVQGCGTRRSRDEKAVVRRIVAPGSAPGTGHSVNGDIAGLNGGEAFAGTPIVDKRRLTVV